MFNAEDEEHKFLPHVLLEKLRQYVLKFQQYLLILVELNFPMCAQLLSQLTVRDNAHLIWNCFYNSLE